MILTPKEKWVVDRLVRLHGYKANFHSYSESQMLLWKPIKSYAGFDWTDTIFFYIDRQMGCWMHGRPWQTPQVHIKWHLSWPTVKNWPEICRAEHYIAWQLGAPLDAPVDAPGRK